MYDGVVNAIRPTFSRLGNKVLSRPYTLKCKQAKPYGSMNEEHKAVNEMKLGDAWVDPKERIYNI